MNSRKLLGPIVALALLPGCAVLAARAGKGGGKGHKPVAAAVETLPPDTVPEDTWPPTTTIPFDPGTPITGTLTGTTGGLHWGDTVGFDVTFAGTPSNRGQVYVKVTCQQGAPVIYQWSQTVVNGADPGNVATHLEFPLVQQDGYAAVGLIINPASSGACSAELDYRILNDKDHTYQVLDSTSFTVQP